jgi:hypothetical protein
MRLAKSYDPYVNHALDRQIGGGLQKLYPAFSEIKREIVRRHAGPALAMVGLAAMLVGWNLG